MSVEFGHHGVPAIMPKSRPRSRRAKHPDLQVTAFLPKADRMVRRLREQHELGRAAVEAEEKDGRISTDASSILLIKDNNAANIRLRRIGKAQNQILLDASREAAAKFPEIGRGAERRKSQSTVQGFSAIQEHVDYFDGLAASVAVVTTVETRRPYVVVIGDSLAKEWPTVAPIYDQVLRGFRELQ